MTPTLIEADWSAPASVLAFCTTRAGGASEGCYQAWNLAEHVGDDPLAVSKNRALLQQCLPPGTTLQWLNQVHGNRIVRAPALSIPDADASWTDTAGIALAVMTADCLPVLLSNTEGTLVAAVHAGWRGLAAGVLENSVAAMPSAAGELLAWLGPAIGPLAYEIGPEVRAALIAAHEELYVCSSASLSAAFAESPVTPGHYLADIRLLAELRLRAMGLAEVTGVDACTYHDSQRFFSYRRDGQCGRIVSVVCLIPR